MAPTIISLIRHGQVHNPGSLYYGRLPGFSLSDGGRREASVAGQYLRSRQVAAIYHSPMLRAEQTASIIQAILAGDSPDLPAATSCELLNEVHTPYDGGLSAEMESRAWDFYTDTPAPFEQPEHVLQRLRAFFDEVQRTYPGQHVLGVTHADPVAFAAMWACGQPLNHARRHFLSLCGVTDDYPATASITSFTFSDSVEGHLPSLSYHNPHLT